MRVMGRLPSFFKCRMKKIYRGISILAGMFILCGVSYGQQAIGSFSQMDGGFEGQGIGTLGSTASSSTPADGIWKRGGSSGGGNATIITQGARSGAQYISVVNTYITNNTSPRTYLSPFTSINPIQPSTSYVIQFYAKASDNANFPNTTIQLGLSAATGTAAKYTPFIPTGSPSAFTKYIVIDSSNTAASNNGFSAIKISSNTANTGKAMDIDDWVIYPGNAADTVAPADPGAATVSNPLGTSLDVSWNPSADVDGGGYVVIRYLTNPTPELNPNVNGIYKVGNSIGNGTVAYVGSSNSFTDAGLSNNTLYYYRIYAADKAFNYSNPVVTSGSTNALVLAPRYYIDSINGLDANPGTLAAPFKNVSKLNGMTILPGTQILLRSGCSWSGQKLKFNGSGTAANPIIVDKYDVGSYPLLAGNGLTGEAVVYLYNQQYIEINHLEITNSPTGNADSVFFVGLYANGNNPLGADRRGVMVALDNFGTANHIYLKNLNIHHVKGQLGNASTMVNGAIPKRTGGIYFDVLGNSEQSSSKSRFNDILIDSCSIGYCENIGLGFDNEWNIYYPGGQNSSVAADVTEYNNWYARRYSNVKVSHNTIHHIGKNAMIIRCTDSTGLIEYNVCYETALGSTGNTMFTARAKGTVFQYNEGYNNRATTQQIEPGNIDGSMYDPDYGSVGIIFQYSYSHDNSHGLYWGCNTRSQTTNTSGIPDPGDVGCVCRYNISQNDKGDLVYFNYPSAGNEIYNNVFYIKQGVSPTIIHENQGSNHTYHYYNNIVYNLCTSSSMYNFGGGSGATQTRTIQYNSFYGQHPNDEPNDPYKIITNPLLVNPGTATLGVNTADGYKLQSGSNEIGSGKTITDNGGLDYFGNAVSATANPSRGVYEPSALVVYTFTGNGNWNVAANWSNNTIPPSTLSGNGQQIVIDPVSNGECVLNVTQTVSNGASISVNAGKKFRIPGLLHMQ